MQLSNLLQLRALIAESYANLGLFVENGFQILGVTLDPFANIHVKVMVPMSKANPGNCSFEILVPHSFTAELREPGFNALLLTCLTDRFVAAIPPEVLAKCSPAIHAWAAAIQRGTSEAAAQERVPAENYRGRAKEILRQLLLDRKAGVDPAAWEDPTPERMEQFVDDFPRIIADAAQGLWRDILPVAVYPTGPLTEAEMQLVEKHVSHRNLRITRFGV